MAILGLKHTQELMMMRSHYDLDDNRYCLRESGQSAKAVEIPEEEQRQRCKNVTNSVVVD